jgi:hypothetical protein
LTWRARDKNRRRSAAFCEDTRNTRWPRAEKNTAIGSHAGEPLVRRIGAALAESAAGHSPDDRALLLARVRLGLSVPALRARMRDGQYRSQRYIVEALRGQDPDPGWEFELWVATGACLAAAAAAIMRWAEGGGREDLPGLMAGALRIITGQEATQDGSEQ